MEVTNRRDGETVRGVRLFFLNAGLLACVNILIRMVSVTFNAYVSGKIGAEGMGLQVGS